MSTTQPIRDSQKLLAFKEYYWKLHPNARNHALCILCLNTALRITEKRLMNIYNHSSYQITKRYLGIEQDDKDNVFMNIVL